MSRAVVITGLPPAFGQSEAEEEFWVIPIKYQSER
jgi:hypothetical protein